MVNFGIRYDDRKRVMKMIASFSRTLFFACAFLVCIASAALADMPATQSIFHKIAGGPFKPTWQSLAAGYKAPDWFRDAKFGIWAHWTAQCVPEQGDWYARRMYIQGDQDYKYHLAHYGHPSTFGFMELDNLWKADKWQPEKLMALYKAAGARYFFALASHHDNFDCFDSTYHDWNSVKVGPKKDIVGIWAKTARAAGLRFGVTNHSSHAWHWFQTAYAYDAVGPLAGVRYDAFHLTRADGKGKWWDGLDPQDLYTGPNIVVPDGITTIKAMNAWRDAHDSTWFETVPQNNPKFVENWYLRCKELIDKYHPDQLYFDDAGLPLEQNGLDIVAHFYNTNIADHGGQLQAVVNGKQLTPSQRPALVEDYERGVTDSIMPEPWQTDTCIGGWHYDRSLFEKHRYKTVGTVVRMLTDIVSKNGNLMLNIPLRGDGTIDDDELKFLQGMAKWMDAESEGIFATRPWKIYGEGPARPVASGNFNEGKQSYTADDIRFTTKGRVLYAYALGVPTNATTVKSLATGAVFARPVDSVSLLGSPEALKWRQTATGLVIEKPASFPAADVIGFKIVFKS
jgi:alpha-L-fucosidase